MRSLSFLAVAILTASVAAGCTPLGDPGVAVWFRNDANVPVIVQFIDLDGKSATGFAVAAKSIGGSYFGFDSPTSWSAQVRVVTSADCKPLWTEAVHEAPSGVVIIDASDTVSLVTSGPESAPAASEVPIPAVVETQKCLPKGVEYVPING